MALDNFRTIELIWNKANKSIIKTIKTASSDTTGRYLSVKILDGGQEVTLNNAKLQLYWEHPNFNTSGTDDFNTVNNGGLFKMTFSNEMLTNIGKLTAHLVLTLTDGKITSDGFTIEVIKGADDGVVVPTNGAGLVKQIDEKIDKGNVTMSDLTQEVKEALTGGSVAVVGKNSVLEETIVNEQVVPEKTNFLVKGNNLFNKNDVIPNATIDSADGRIIEGDRNVHEFYIAGGATISKTKSAAVPTAYFDENGDFIRYDSWNINADSVQTPTNAHKARISVGNVMLNNLMLNYGSETLEHEPFTYRVSEKTPISFNVDLGSNSVKNMNLEDGAVTPDKTSYFRKSRNLFNKNTVMPGKNMSNGNIVDDAGRNLSQLIPVYPGATLSKTKSAFVVLNEYGSDGQWIREKPWRVNAEPMVLGNDVWFASLAPSDIALETFMLNEGAETLPYEEFAYILESNDTAPIKIDRNLISQVARAEKIKPFRQHDYEKLPYNDLVASLSDTGATVETLGPSADENVNVYGLKYGDTSVKPTILIVGDQHGSEWRASYYVRDFIEYITGKQKFYDQDLIQKINDTFAFYFIPSASPTGYIDETYNNRNGVNLNRNYDNNWSNFDEATRGSEPFSEFETQYIRDKVLELKPIMVIDCHTSGLMAAGIDTGKTKGTHNEFLTDVYHDINNSFDDASLYVQEWNTGHASTLVGWSGTQENKKGDPIIPVLLEMQPSYNGNYGLTGLFYLVKAVYDRVTN